MELAIQRRQVYLTPPSGKGDAAFVLRTVDAELGELFGWTDPDRAQLNRLEADGQGITWVVRRVADEQRIGVGLLLAVHRARRLLPRPPGPAEGEAWECGVFVRDPTDPEGRRGIEAADAIGHLVVDQLGIDGCWRRFRAEDREGRAVALRMGYELVETRAAGPRRLAFLRLARSRWIRRSHRLEADEARRSPPRRVFVPLTGPPYRPTDPVPVGPGEPGPQLFYQLENHDDRAT